MILPVRVYRWRVRGLSYTDKSSCRFLPLPKNDTSQRLAGTSPLPDKVAAATRGDLQEHANKYSTTSGSHPSQRLGVEPTIFQMVTQTSHGPNKPTNDQKNDPKNGSKNDPINNGQQTTRRTVRRTTQQTNERTNGPMKVQRTVQLGEQTQNRHESQRPPAANSSVALTTYGRAISTLYCSFSACSNSWSRSSSRRRNGREAVRPLARTCSRTLSGAHTTTRHPRDGEKQGKQQAEKH